MLNFKSWLAESAASGNYVAINVRSGIVIPSIGEVFGESHVCSPEDQHITLMYSTDTNIKKAVIVNTLSRWDEIDASMDSVDAFDGKDSDTCTIVIKVNSPKLTEMYDDLVQIGLKHSYPTFTPHISVLYNIPRDQKEKAILLVGDWVKENAGSVSLSGFNVNAIIKNWADTIND